METLQVELIRHGRWRLLNIHGRIDQATAVALADQLYDALTTWSPLAVCLDDAELSDRAWLQVIVDTHQHSLRLGRTFAVVAADESADAALAALLDDRSPQLHVVRGADDLSPPTEAAVETDPTAPSVQV